MTNDTIMLLMKLQDKLDNADRYNEDGDSRDPVAVVSEAIEQLLDEEAPVHTCAPEPYEMKAKREEQERIARGEPRNYFTNWGNCFVWIGAPEQQAQENPAFILRPK